MTLPPVTFGLNIDPDVVRARDLIARVQLAERAGYDLAAIQDHPYQPRFYDAWTLIPFLAAHTTSLSFTSNVANLGLRMPTLLANSAATLSRLTEGRVHLGVGAGRSGGPISSMGAVEHTGKDMIDYVEQGLGLMRAALRGGPVQLETSQYAVHGYEAGPPVRDPVELWVGALKPRMLGVVGRAADGWLAPISSYLRPSMVPALRETIDKAAADAGRDPAGIRRIYNVAGAVTDGALDADALAGPVDQWVEWLLDWHHRLGFHGFVFWPMTDRERQAAVFGEEIIPRVRAELA